MAKSEGIDILALYSMGNYEQWNAFLTTALQRRDISGLVDVLRRLQIGMDNLVQQKLNTDQVGRLFLRLQRSIENTIQQIHRLQNPNPLFGAKEKGPDYAKQSQLKSAKQNELERFLKRARY